MNLPITHSTDTHRGSSSRLAALALRSALALSFVALGCGRGDKSAASESTTAAATPGTTATDTSVVASASAGETASSAPTPAPRADTAPAATSESAPRHADSAAAAAKAPRESAATRAHAAAPTHAAPTHAAPTHEAPARQAPAAAPAPAPAAAAPAPASKDTGQVSTAKAQTAAAPEKADSTCSTENGAAGVQPAKPGPDPLLVSQTEYDGWKMFHVYCYRCHGVDAMGGGIAPNLRHSLGPEGSVDHACFVRTVTEGRPAKGMPTWKSLLDSTQIENIWHYLQARSSGRLVPGRPHTAGNKEG